MNTETVTVHRKGENFEITVQHDQSDSAYGMPLSKNAYEQLRQHFVSGSLLSKTYEIDFGGNLKCKIRVCGSELEVEAAMNGWGNGIPCSEISVVELQ